MAMSVLVALGRGASRESIVATDLYTNVLATARESVYPEVLTFLEKFMRLRPMPVLMISSLTER